MIRVELYPGTVPAPVGESLRALERAFNYPLGPDERFSIDHGAEYGRFYGSMGESVCVVAYEGTQPQATVSAALRRASWPGGEGAVVYGGDLKVHPRARGGAAYHRVARVIAAWSAERAPRVYSVVMGGTTLTPEAYSGRAGLTALRLAGGLEVFSVAAGAGTADAAEAPPPAWDAAFGALTRGAVVPYGGTPASRSSARPRLLLEPSDEACGRLEDTRLAKRLLRGDGSEIRAAHLAAFAFGDARAGAALVRRARALALSGGAERLFFSVPATRAEELAAALADLAPGRAAAALYAAGDWPAAAAWIVSSSEI